MVLDCRQVVPDYPAIRESMCPAGHPETHAPLVPQVQAGPTHYPPVTGLGPRPNLDSKPSLLSLEFSAVLRPPPSPPSISQSRKSQNP